MSKNCTEKPDFVGDVVVFVAVFVPPVEKRDDHQQGENHCREDAGDDGSSNETDALGLSCTSQIHED